MKPKSFGTYPYNWKEIAIREKEYHDYHCICCGKHHKDKGHITTVHHLDMNCSLCEWFNLAVLCQKCHLKIQNKIIWINLSYKECPDYLKSHWIGYWIFMFTKVVIEKEIAKIISSKVLGGINARSSRIPFFQNRG